MYQDVCSAIRVVASGVFLLFAVTASAFGEQWKIPLGGNAFPGEGVQARLLGRGGVLSLSGDRDRFSVYFRADRGASLNLAMEGRSKSPTTVVAQVGGDTLRADFKGREIESPTLGKISAAAAGYVRVDLAGTRGMKDAAELTHLVVSSDDPELKLDYVRDNKGSMFYWGRRGPSVHLSYRVPRDRELTHAYSEITVPEGEDPIGSYYMANGFGQGYFGFQVNSATERRVLFSVWSPYKTDDPREIPEDQRITALAQGDGVHVGKFGNEGSGGQSYLVYPWKAGATYRFLTEVRPDGQGRTIYTSWFGDKSKDEWRLIARFRRPKTDTYLRGFHSFLESFSPQFGHIGRRAWWGNVWVRDVNEQWHECTTARLTVDATGRGRHRLDYAGGAQGNRFFMRNCGFFDETVPPDQNFTRSSSADAQPRIDFAKLPGMNPPAIKE